MNRRQHKKNIARKESHYTFFIKICLNDNQTYNPVIKRKGWQSFLRGIRYYHQKYHCEIAFACPDLNMELDNRLEYSKAGD